MLLKSIFSILLAIIVLCQWSSLQFASAASRDIVLVDGESDRNPAEGTVITYANGRWGSICDDRWSIREANVVCRELGFPSAKRATRADLFRTHPRYSNYVMDDVNCRGNETRLAQCRYWTRHNCGQKEHAGVICRKKTGKKRFPSWNPLGFKLTRQQIQAIYKKPFTVSLTLRSGTNDTFLVNTGFSSNSRSTSHGKICRHNFDYITANLLCQKSGMRGAHALRIFNATSTRQRINVRMHRCFGNESDIGQCTFYSSASGSVPCPNNTIVQAVQCTRNLSDIVTDFNVIQSSVRIEIIALRHLFCALEEGCFPKSVYRMVRQEPRRYVYSQRRLLRFSTIISNIGNGDFTPLNHPDDWDWHSCHNHYHSMEVFAVYEILDARNRKVTTGHKSSFCLEDALCGIGVRKKYVCSTTRRTKGSQGISPGCSDTYLDSYDCQWIDVSDLASGYYTFQMVINPGMQVPEITYINNAVRCRMTLRMSLVSFRNCTLIHPFDLVR